MEVKIADSRDGICIFSRTNEYLAQIDTMYVDEVFYGVRGLYVNRVIVPKEIRNKGIATQMMNELIKKSDEKQINLILEINAYGDLNEDKLKEFYGKFGFIESKIKGVYVRIP